MCGDFFSLRKDTECYFIVDCATNLEKVVLHGDPERSTHSEPKTTEKKNIRSEDLLGVNLSVNRQKGEDSLDILQLQELDVRGFPQLQVLPTKDVCRTQMPFISTCIFENIRTRQGCESLEVVLSGLAQRDVSKVNRRKVRTDTISIRPDFFDHFFLLLHRASFDCRPRLPSEIAQIST